MENGAIDRTPLQTQSKGYPGGDRCKTTCCYICGCFVAGGHYVGCDVLHDHQGYDVFKRIAERLAVTPAEAEEMEKRRNILMGTNWEKKTSECERAQQGETH